MKKFLKADKMYIIESDKCSKEVESLIWDVEIGVLHNGVEEIDLSGVIGKNYNNLTAEEKDLLGIPAEYEEGIIDFTNGLSCVGYEKDGEFIFEGKIYNPTDELVEIH